MACNKNEWHPVHWINYWISTIAKFPPPNKMAELTLCLWEEMDLVWPVGGINVMSMGRNGSSLAWMTTTYETHASIPYTFGRS
jgi:hypothetical protein